MKKQILNVVVTLSVIATLSIAGFAALNNEVRSNVPFDFKVNGKTMSAGNYTITKGSTPSLLIIRSRDAKQSVCVIAQRLEVEPGSKPQLIFRRYGNQYFLAEVIGNASGNELPKSKAEREAAKAGRDYLAQNEATPEIVAINAQVGQ